MDLLRLHVQRPKVKVADPEYNAGAMIKIIEEAEGRGANILVFSELTISGYTCGDLFLQQPLLKGCTEKDFLKSQLLQKAEICW